MTVTAIEPAVQTPPEPQPNDLKAQQRADAKALKDLIRPVAAQLNVGRALAVISAVLAVVPYIALVHIGASLLDSARTDTAVDGDEVGRWLRILIITFTLRLGIYFLALLITHFADIRFGHLVRERMVARLSKVPLNWFTSTNSGRVRTALQDDIGTVHHLIAHQPVDGTNAIVMPLALMVYAFIVDWRLGLLSIATLPLYATMMAFSMRGMGEKTVEMDQRLATVSARMVEFVTGISVVKAFGRVGRAHRAYQEAADEFQEFYYAWVKPMIRGSSLGISLLAVPLILLINIGGGAWLVHRGTVTPADVLATSLIALLVPYALETLMSAMWSQQMAGAAATRLVTLLDTPALPDDGQGAVPAGGEVVFDDVSYSYGQGDDAVLALDGVSFTLREGTITALVGPSGSGKSTIATLLARFDDPRSGTISIGGVPVGQIADLYSHVGFVLQDPQLLGISIRDNIALGRPDATDEQIRAAARAARVLDEIEALPNGLDTVYGSDTGLSGGQAQRIAIARALLVDAPILILDEATALTDLESQHQIQQALSELVKGRTVLLIGHRPEVITGVDQIVLVESGRVVATGTHDDLLAERGYARLWESAGHALEDETDNAIQGDRR
ncbi:putative iron-siderophore ABC transporter permease/ATP-binding protein [Gordonia araii NBRC 100433]|uniref:Putative iron-siderophore ABC transporter permease/ATP-binding protein n=1 Tax=Gordonia araii NBRC 100433 TaxID=1073574 RepID=G7H207_9ACTN|nr:ABC transporter ATP-binding protein [Gordonia araii]NNG97215.1 ABC transporter ATP-binding protein [Gordonia araii NBRC 100433]GAB09882.1 putative iron-siderophore ABC transporter permease/ATP-binding protein [Gordonia araii NBRC 100433]